MTCVYLVALLRNRIVLVARCTTNKVCVFRPGLFMEAGCQRLLQSLQMTRETYIRHIHFIREVKEKAVELLIVNLSSFVNVD